MELIELSIKGISFNQVQEGAYTLLLQEVVSGAKIPIIIGGLEAQTIAVALEKNEEKKKHFIYSLFTNIFISLDTSLQKIIIYSLEEGIFFSYLICKSDHEEKKINSMAVHALALAIYFEVPIYVTKEIFVKFSFPFEIDTLFKKERKENIFLDELPKKNRSENDMPLKNMTIENLSLLLEKALVDEYYEFAILIKEEMDKRNI